MILIFAACKVNYMLEFFYHLYSFSVLIFILHRSEVKLIDFQLPRVLQTANRRSEV